MEYGSSNQGTSQPVGTSSAYYPPGSQVGQSSNPSVSSAYIPSSSIVPSSSSQVQQPSGACDVASAIGASGSVGSYAPDFVTIDQHGDEYRLCEYGGSKPIVIQISAEWCGPCRAISDEISNNGPTPAFPDNLVDYINNDEIVYVELMVQSGNQQPADLATLQRWEQQYSHPKVSIISDGGYELIGHLGIGGGFPTYAVIDSDYKFVQMRSTYMQLGQIMDQMLECLSRAF
jgi:thiol-disulfide isomerase/thioredoxin